MLESSIFLAATQERHERYKTSLTDDHRTFRGPPTQEWRGRRDHHRVWMVITTQRALRCLIRWSVVSMSKIDGRSAAALLTIGTRGRRLSYLDQFREVERSLPTPVAVEGRCCPPEGALHAWFITRALDRRRYKGGVQTSSVARTKAAAGMVKNRRGVMVMRFPV